ncbi:MAG: TonB-dependent receptor [Acidobacteriota bacterium]|nr:TonB-dependent receptor [Acidobacteriota bacterium]
MIRLARLIFSGIGIFLPMLFGQETEELTDLTLNELMGIEIEVDIASKNSEKVWEAPGIISVINSNEISQFGAMSLVDLLNRVASVYMLNTYFSPNNFTSFRGDSQIHYDNHVLLLLDGRPMRESQTGSFNSVIYQAFPLSALKRIEVIRGPGSALYGASAYSGVINLVTGKDEDGTHLEINAGSYDGQGGKFNHQGFWNGLYVFLAAGTLAEDGWDFNAVDEAGTPQSLKFGEENMSFLAKLSYGAFTLTTLGVQSKYDYWGGTPTGGGTERDHARYFANLGWKKKIGKMTTEANLTYNRMDVRNNARNLAEDLLLEVTNYFKVGRKTRLIVGALANNTTGEWAPLVPAYDKTSFSAYFQADYKPSERFKLIVGGQLNKPDGGESDFVPRIGMIANLSGKTGVKLLYGEAFRSPAAVETDFNVPPVIVGNPDLIPETVSTGELQLFHEGNKYQVAATYFHSEQDQLIGREFTPGGAAFFTYGNLGTGKLMGFELEGKYAPDERTYTTFSATFQENENGNGVEGFTTLPRFMAKLGFVRRFGERFNLGLFDTYFDDAEGVTTTNPGASLFNPPADAFHLISANLAVTLRKTERPIKLELFGQNLLDEDTFIPELARRRMNTIPAYPGRSLYLGINFDF